MYLKQGTQIQGEEGDSCLHDCWLKTCYFLCIHALPIVSVNGDWLANKIDEDIKLFAYINFMVRDIITIILQMSVLLVTF